MEPTSTPAPASALAATLAATLTAGDVGINSVTVALFSDPDGNGSPSDGALVRVTSTDASGYYELLNLATGAGRYADRADNRRHGIAISIHRVVRASSVVRRIAATHHSESHINRDGGVRRQ